VALQHNAKLGRTQTSAQSARCPLWVVVSIGHRDTVVKFLAGVSKCNIFLGRSFIC